MVSACLHDISLPSHQLHPLQTTLIVLLNVHSSAFTIILSALRLKLAYVVK